MYLHETLLLGIFLATAFPPSVAEVKTDPYGKGSAASTKRIPCTVTNEKFVSWKLPNGKRVISTDTKDRPHVVKEVTKYFLVIVGLKSSDGGIYTCIGSKTTARFELRIQFNIKKGEIKDQKLLLKKDGVIKLGASGNPKPTFKWTKEGTAITPSGRYSIQEDGSLNISKVEKIDQGSYKCDVSQFEGQDVDNAEVNVKVFDPAKIIQSPEAEKRPSKGFNVTMKCVASGYPAPSYKWKNQGGSDISTHGRFHVNKGELTILGVLPSDKGTYTCEASSGDGSVAKAKSNIVEVYVAPTIGLSTLPKIEKDLGESQTIECTANSGTAPVRVTWKKEGIKDERQKESAGKSVLTLAKVRLIDVGKYTCEASNNARDSDGKTIVVKTSVDLFVRSKPEINQKASPGDVYSFVGNKEPVHIRCSFTGYPPPKVKIFDTKNKKVANGTEDAIYELFTKTFATFTTYRCNAVNVYGNLNYTVTLKLAERPAPVIGLTKTDLTCNAVTIKWQEPEKDGGMPVVQYVVEYMKSLRNVQAPNTQYEAIELKPASDYTFSVWPRNKAHPGTKEEIAIKTKEFCKPSRPVVLAPLSEILEDTTFLLKWRRPEEDGGDPNFSYKVRYAPVAEADENVEKKELKTTGLEITVSDLKLGTKYNVEVVAINKGGESEPATRQYQVPRVAARSRSHAASASVLFTTFAVGLSLMMK